MASASAQSNTCKLLTEPKIGLQFNYARSGCLRLVEPAERDQGPDQDDIVDAVTWIGLYRPVSGLCRLIRSLQKKVSERLRAKRRE